MLRVSTHKCLLLDCSQRTDRTLSTLSRFPYTDTLKILQKWGPGCEFFGHGLLSDLPALRELLSTSVPPVLAIFCEFPSNPLLRTPPLKELRKLADEFGAMIVIDETIAGFVNVEVLPGADVVVSSLTKVFSGDSNVMGGRCVIPACSRSRILTLMLTYVPYFPSSTKQFGHKPEITTLRGFIRITNRSIRRQLL